MSSVLARPKRGGRPPSDVKLGDGPGIADCLRVKGFCVINDALSEAVVKEAVAQLEAEAVEFYQPAALVQEGLLGMEGSQRIAKLGSGEGAENPGLQAIDTAMMDLANAVGPWQAEIGFECTTRSGTLFHEAAEPSIDETDLVDSEANEWSTQFVSRKIMFAAFLGPERGTLELTPFDEDANPTDIATFPGSIVIVRTDQMSFSFATRGSKAGFVATSFMLQGNILGMHRNKADAHMCPAAREIHSWIEGRLREIKENEEDEPNWDKMETAIPRNFIAAANRTWFKKTQTAVRGMACRVPSSWEPEVMFLALTSGADVITDVPYCRWDHSDIYDPDPQSWQQQPPKTACRHAGFYEGIELFDAKMFSLSIAEVKGMDPSQRQVLEVTYDALFRSGMKKGTLSNSSCGMYVGMSTSEWNYAERSADVGIFGATGGAPSICAGRLSFCLGCKGASLAVDTEAASGLSSVFWAAESVEKKGVGYIQELACGIGVHLILAKAWWPAHSAAGFLSPTGRCQAFDNAADGYVRSEATGTAVVRAKPETMVDGEVVKDDLPLVGIICGGATMNSGKSAGMAAPSGPTEQAILHEACRKSGIMPYDIDAIECHGSGKFIADAVEVASCGKALRDGTTDEMLQICSVKSNAGNGVEGSGLVSLAKTLHSIRWGIVVSNQHLRQLNPHLDIGEAPLLLADEHLEYRNSASFVSISSHGFGGTNVNVQLFGGVEEDLRPAPEPTPEEFRPKLTYWPAGGGHPSSENRPRKGFFITGSWNCWEPEQMLDEGEGVHSFTVILGDNRWEQFQLMIDASAEKILYPPFYRAPKGTEIMGPTPSEDVGRGGTWLIEARGAAGLPQLPNGAITEAGEGQAVTPDEGQPGDRYKVCLHTAGKWRTVTWSKVEATEGESAALSTVPVARYYVAGSWNGWGLEEMTADASTPGLYTLEVCLTKYGTDFQIVRNKDWSQAFCPMVASAGPEAEIYGPDDTQGNLCWHIDAGIGTTIKIEFQRTWDESSDVKRVSWRSIS